MSESGLQCAVCGGAAFKSTKVLWPSLIDTWQLSPPEVEYINRQQGEHCTRCGANLRSIALARSILAAAESRSTLESFCSSSAAAKLSVLELNEAGTLHPVLSKMTGHKFGAYPEVDMHALPYPDSTFDLVIHSDTLEHVPNPVHALKECRRVLKPGGTLCFTVPIIIGRLTRDRTGLPASYHGNADAVPADFKVQIEFGADAWTYVMAAGFSEVRFYAVEFPCAIAISAMK